MYMWFGKKGAYGEAQIEYSMFYRSLDSFKKAAVFLELLELGQDSWWWWRPTSHTYL